MPRRTLIRFSLAAALALGAGACASTSDVQHLQNQVADLQDQVAQLKRTASSKEEVQSVNARVGEQTSALLKSNATLVAKVDQIEDKVNNSQGSQEEANHRIDRLSQQVTQLQHDLDEVLSSRGGAQAPGGAAVTPVAAPPAAAPATAGAGAMSEVSVAADNSESPVLTYQNAYRDYQQGRYDLAIAGFKEFAQKNPTSELAGNAAYWVGESLYSQKKYRESIAQFDRVVTNYPRSEKVPSALLKKGYAYISIGDKAQGIVQLQYVVHEHPRSPEASKAREELKKLGVKNR